MVIVSGNGIVNGVLRGNGVDVDAKDGSGVLCFSLDSRLRGKDGGSAPFTLTPTLSHRGRGGLIGELCFSLGSRVRGNDGVVRGNDGGICAFHPHPSPLPSRERGINRRALLFSGFPRARERRRVLR